MIAGSVWVASSASSPARLATGRQRGTYRASFSTASSSVLAPRSKPGQSAATATQRLPRVGSSMSTRSCDDIGSSYRHLLTTSPLVTGRRQAYAPLDSAPIGPGEAPTRRDHDG